MLSCCRCEPAIIQHCLHVYGRSAAQAEDPSAGADTGAHPSSSNVSSYVLDERQVCLHYARKLLQQRAAWPLHAFLPAWEQEVPGGVWNPSEDMLSGEALVLQADPLEGMRQSRRGLESTWQYGPCGMLVHLHTHSLSARRRAVHVMFDETSLGNYLWGTDSLVAVVLCAGISEARVRHFPASQLPCAPAARFAALFAAQPRWTREQLDPYLAQLRVSSLQALSAYLCWASWLLLPARKHSAHRAVATFACCISRNADPCCGMLLHLSSAPQVPGQTVEMLLLKYARASQRSPTDSTVVFVAR
jgi:hypothetical protein